MATLDLPSQAFFPQLMSRLAIRRAALVPQLRQLRGWLSDGLEEISALRLFADALDDPMLGDEELADVVPVLSALTTRPVVSACRFLEHGERRRLVAEVTTVIRRMLRDRRISGLERLPLLASSAAALARRGSPAAALIRALPRIEARLASEPGLVLRLQRAAPSRLDTRQRGTRGLPRQFELSSPVEIAILTR